MPARPHPAPTDALLERVQRLLADPRLDEATDREVLRVVAGHIGHENPVTAREICDRLGWPLDERGRRRVTQAVAWLVECGAPIGASRVPPMGYFLILTETDRKVALAALTAEWHALLRRQRRLQSWASIEDTFRQMRLALEQEEAAHGGEQPEEAA